MGTFTFNNSVTASSIGNPFAAFLLGIPDSTGVATVTATDADAFAQHYGVFRSGRLEDQFEIHFELWASLRIPPDV